MLRAIATYDGGPETQAALELLALTFVHSGELRAAEWSEFDLTTGVWAIPAEKMKMKRPHRVPLAPQAIAINEMTGHGFRSAASSMLNESGLWNADAIERQLAHVDDDSVRRAYARADYCWDERVRMMAWWADRCEEMRHGAQVILLRTG